MAVPLTSSCHSFLISCYRPTRVQSNGAPWWVFRHAQAFPASACQHTPMPAVEPFSLTAPHVHLATPLVLQTLPEFHVFGEAFTRPGQAPPQCPPSFCVNPSAVVITFLLV